MSKQLALTVNQINIDDDDPALDVDINVLQQYASCRLNRHCICARRLTRGLYNEIYLLQFENGPDCIARLSRELTHPASKFASEVATMKYVTQNTNIKVPATKCQFKEIGCLYMDEQTSSSATSTFQIGPVVNYLFHSKGRDSIPSSTGPFKSLKELYGTLIQKEKEFFEIHGAQKLLHLEGIKIDHGMEVTRVKNPIKKLGLLQSKLSNIFDELVDQKPFTLIHNDFDAQNMLVERSSTNDIKIVGIIDWEFSRTGTLWDLCKYPVWIQEIDELPISDANLKENHEKQNLRDFFYDEMVVKLRNGGGQMLKMKEQDKRIEDLDVMFAFIVKKAKANIKLADLIMRLFWGPSLTKVQIPSERTINSYLLSADRLSDTEMKVPDHYVASVYCELKSRDYNFSWQQASVIAFHMQNNESKNSASDVNKVS
ncbi:kinase-like domain-containing protein [Rhizophagus irregularis DAOM 181602=DAOM 197198]|nr:kinase-like domain-containing protein [Rhizophagus irregularis DAOM 181602=DAOM 197198]